MATEDKNKKKSIDDMLQNAAIEKFGLKPVMDKIEKVMPLLEQVAAGSEVLKGQDGKSPELGVDYLTPEQQQAALEMVRPKKGVDYQDGNPGADGYTPIKGLDYFTDDEVADVTRNATPVKGRDYYTAEEAADFKKQVTPIKGVDYKDGENPTPAQFIEVVKALKGKDAAAFSQVVGSKIDISHVRNAGTFIFNGKKYDTSELMHGGGSSGNVITLQTDGVDNGSQTLLNLAAGNNITLVDDGTGTITITAIGDGTGTVTSVASGTGLTGGPITTTGTLSLATPIAPIATLGSAGQLIRVNAGATALEYFTAASGGVTSVVGTSNRITVDSTDPTAPVVDIAATYVGQTSITTLGTIATGTWAGTTVAVAHGGTGLTTLAAKSIWVANTLDTITSVTPAAGQSIRINAGNTAWEAYTPAAGTVTAVSVASANGFAGSSSGGATPALTISTTITGILQGDGTAISAATTTGSGSVVLATSPTLTTASLGSSTATTQTPSDNSTKVATTAYVDNAVLGQNFKEACGAATTANLVGVYLNGTSGVGATFTYTSTGVDTIDGITLTLGMRVLVKNQTTTFQNGIYTVTTAGAVGVAGILTRATDSDQSTDWKTGDSVFITAGTTQSTTTWAYTGADGPTIGTDAITFVQTAGQGSFTAGNGISITGNSIAIDTSVTVDKTTAQTLTNKTLTSPILTTPALGTPASGVMTNVTGVPAAAILAGSFGAGAYVISTSLQVATIELGAATDTTLSRVSAGVIAVEGVTIPSISSTNTLTNKRITRRLTTVNAPGATPTTNTDNVDVQNFTGLGTAITSMTTNLSGTPTDGQLVEFRFTDDGTARGITWGTSFEATTVSLPTTTVISTMLRVLFEWNATASKYDCIAVA